MTPFKLFYSWQSDLDPKVSRRFIEQALEDAARTVSSDLAIEIEVDADTRGVAGTPPITETLLGKIAACDVFVADVSLVARTAKGKGVPNPNVMAECGHALATLGWGKTLLVMNTAFGPPKDLPFDFKHRRFPAKYRLETAADPASRRAVKDRLTRDLARNITAILEGARAAPSPVDPRREGAYEALQGFRNSVFRGGSTVLVSNPRLQVQISPFAAADHPRLDPKRVTAAQGRFPPSSTVKVREGGDADEWWSSGLLVHPPGLPNGEAPWRTRLVRPGLLEFAMTIGGREGDDPTILVSGHRLEAWLVEAVERLCAIAVDLGLEGPAFICASLEGAEDVELTRSRPGGGPIRKGSNLFPVAEVPTLLGEQAGHLREMMDQMWLASGWRDGSPSFEGDRWAGYDNLGLYDAAPR